MTDSIGSVAASAAIAPQPTPATAAASAAPPAPPAKPTPPAPTPLSVDVVRSDAGVFIYTLRDPATDTVLAVIPREAVVSGRNVDEHA